MSVMLDMSTFFMSCTPSSTVLMISALNMAFTASLILLFSCASINPQLHPEYPLSGF